MGLTYLPIEYVSVYLGTITGTTYDAAIRRIFTNTTGFDVVIDRIYMAGLTTTVAGYMTLTVADQDGNTIVAGNSNALQTGTGIKDLGACSATHGVIPDGEYVKVTFGTVGTSHTITDCALQIKYHLQSVQD